MDILLSIMAFVAVVISIALISIGAKKKVSGCLSIGGIMLLITVIAAVSYYFDWYVPLIFIFGTAGMLFSLMGTNSDNDGDSTGIDILETVIGVVLIFIALYYWYREGWYTSLGFITSLLGFLFFLNGTQSDSEYIPVLSLSVGILFALATIYLWMFLEINGYIVFLGGLLGGLILKAMCKVFYEKDYWIKKGAVFIMTPFFLMSLLLWFYEFEKRFVIENGNLIHRLSYLNNDEFYLLYC